MVAVLISPKFFKFTDPAGLNFILAGSLKFGRLKYYRLQEVFDDEKWIGDRDEGLRRTIADNFEISPDQPNIQLRRELEQAGLIKLSNGNTLRVSGLEIIREVDCFVFCLSHGDKTELSKIMFYQSGKEIYSECVGVNDIDCLIKAIETTARFGEHLISETFNVAYGLVKYEPLKAHDLSLNRKIAPADPFLKSELFKDQQEFRIALFQKLRLEIDAAVINVDLPHGLLTVEGLDHSTDIRAVSKPLPSAPLLNEAIDAFDRAVRSWVAEARAMRDVQDFSEGWMERANERKEAENRAFQPHRVSITKAYAPLRPHLQTRL